MCGKVCSNFGMDMGECLEDAGQAGIAALYVAGHLHPISRESSDSA